MQWIKASDKIPELYPVNNTHENHYKLDAKKVDGYFLHSRCFEYFNDEISGFSHIELSQFNRIEWLDESAPSPVEGKSAEEILAKYESNGEYPNYYHESVVLQAMNEYSSQYRTPAPDKGVEEISGKKFLTPEEVVGKVGTEFSSGSVMDFYVKMITTYYNQFSASHPQGEGYSREQARKIWQAATAWQRAETSEFYGGNENERPNFEDFISTLPSAQPKEGDTYADGQKMNEGDRVYSYDFEPTNDTHKGRVYGTLLLNTEHPNVSKWYVAYDDGLDCAVLDTKDFYKA